MRDKPGFLIATMRELAGAAEISFEGALGESGLFEVPGVSFKETAALHRADQSGQLDFLVLPLTDEVIPAILAVITEKEHLGYASGIHHVQIAVASSMVLGAYDNFDRNCVVAYEGFPTGLLDRLAANGVIRSYQAEG